MKRGWKIFDVLLLLLIGCAATPAATVSTISPAASSIPSTRLPAAAGTTFRQAQATAYYVCPEGGSTEECTGQTDAPYPGSGTGQDCAWDHPFRALPPGGSPRIAGGDTLIIAAGSYMMGYGAPGADTCDSDYPYDCHIPPIPSGPDPANRTRILGEGWDTGCSSPPELWGTERPWYILNLTDSSNVEIACLEITDHSDCVEDHTGGLACNRDNYPYGDWAPVGLYAEDSANVYLHDLNIHGLANTGIHAGRLTDWTVEDVRVAGNGWAGWDGDLGGGQDSSNSGTMLFRRWTVEWNGCGETYPGGEPTGCWGQSAGGYGDGIGTGETGGHWIIEDSAFLHNTSDGLDLLYTREEGSLIEIRRTIAEGNAGDQVKTTGPTLVENVGAVSNCGYFDGQSFTHSVDNCRAGGSAIAFTLRTSNHITVVNSTITGQGDCLVIAECADGYTCGGSESVLLRNSVFQGNPEFSQADDTTCLTWYGTAHDPFNLDYSIVNGVKGEPDPCPTHSMCGIPPGLVNPAIDAFDAHLLQSSPAIDAGTTEGAPPDDFDGRPRDATPDIGAYEYAQWVPTAWVYLPLVLKGWSASQSQAPPEVAGCAVFPADNVWNAPVDTLPVDTNSDTYIATIGADAYVHADFGSGTWEGGPIGIPYVDVPGTQPLVTATFEYDDESDPGPYPIPTDAPIEGGSDSDGDRHVLVVDHDNCILYELFYAWPQPDGSWHAGSGAIFDLNSNALRPAGWTSADAAGLPILPGLVRYDEMAAGEIRHALRFTAPQTRRVYVWPARHYASHLTGEQYPPMGQRFRLRADFDIAGFSPEVQVILRALKKYGMMLADNGSAWFISGLPDERWNNDVLHELHRIKGSDFEAVDASSLMVNSDSGQVRSP